MFPLHSALKQTLPAGSGVQVPTWPGNVQLSQFSSQAESQQTPPTQNGHAGVSSHGWPIVADPAAPPSAPASAIAPAVPLVSAAPDAPAMPLVPAPPDAPAVPLVPAPPLAPAAAVAPAPPPAAPAAPRVAVPPAPANSFDADTLKSRGLRPQATSTINDAHAPTARGPGPRRCADARFTRADPE